MFRTWTSIALGGGGVRGGLQIGALAALEAERGNLSFPDGVYGSSIGSILATAVAFNMTAAQIKFMFDNHFTRADIIPSLRLSNIGNLATSKGLYTMDHLEKGLLKAFDSQNIDLRNKVIADAPQPLRILASNMTTQRPTIFTGNVLILDAIKASSCIPLIFAPQIIFNHVYLDGGVFTDSLASVVPETCLVMHISEPSNAMFASQLTDMPIASFLHMVYRSMRTKRVPKNTLWLHNDTIGILHDITPKDKQDLYEQGYSQTRAFLAKRLSQKLN